MIRASLTLLLVCLSFAPNLHAAPTELFFSEYIEGSSNNKALEIYNGTSSPVTLTEAYSVQMFFNGSSSAGLTLSLNGTIAPGDVFVLAHSSANATILAQADQTNGGGWFNGDDAVVLRKGMTVIDVIGQIGFDPGSEWGSGLTSTADNTLRRKSAIEAGDPIGSDAFVPSLEWDGFATDTFGGLGSYSTTPPPPVVTLLEIHAIQGSGAASPVAGQNVKSENNIVTAKTSNGFFIQTPEVRYDADSMSSQGIFVFTGSAPTVNVGDQVDVTGTAVEFFNLTEISNVTAVTIDHSGNPLPSAVTLDAAFPSPSGNATQLERVEGMLVSMANGVATAPSDQFGDFAVVARSTRAFREPGLAFDGNPEIFEIDPNALAGMADVLVNAGSGVSATGPLSFAFGDYQIFPSSLTVVDDPAEAPVRARNAGEMTVGAQNMLRLFDLVNDPGVDDETPATAQEYYDRLTKASLRIRTILGSPDVLAVSEVENLGVLDDVAEQVNADDPSLGYTPYLMEGNDVGGIDVGFLVRNTVDVDSIEQIGLDTLLSVDGSLLNDRPSLVLRGAYAGNGAAFPIIVIAVHHRSLSGIETTSRVRQKRHEQAAELAVYVQSLQTSDPSARVVITGDFNAFEFSDGYVDVLGQITGNCDPAGAMIACTDLVDPNLTNQVLNVGASERYSFIFDGSAQVLDHSLTSAGLQPYVRGLEYGRGNADAPRTFDDDPTTSKRMSDHDGPVLFIMTDHDGDGLADDADPCAQGDARPTVIVGDCDSGVANQFLSPGCTIADKLNEILASSRNHGQYVADVARFLNDLMRDGTITGEEKGQIEHCTGASN